jgi:polar amino acid transport system substrate-binding protein
MKRIVTLIFLIFIVAGSVCAQTLTIYTEEFPPYNFTQQGKISGVSTEVVQHILADAGFKAIFKSLPWDQAYKLAQEQENALIYSISRRLNREKLFKWIGVLTPATYSVFAPSSRTDIRINRLDDLKKFKIGTSVDDARESYLLGKGFKLSDFQRTAGNNANLVNFQKLVDGRIELWPMPDAVAYYIARQEGRNDPHKVFHKVFALNELSGGYYLAASLNTSNEIVEKIAAALDRYLQTDDYKQVLSNWGLKTTGVIEFAHFQKLIYAMTFFTRMDRIGYLAGDTLSTHKDGEWLRRGLREEVIERYVRSFDEWRESFARMQHQVDILVIGNNAGIKGWDNASAEKATLLSTAIPTGCVMDWMSNYTFIGYAGDKLILNKKIAGKLKLEFPESFVKKATLIIE